MDVFISWSGERSRAVAETLRKWLPTVIQALKPWTSSKDIASGKKWKTILDKQLYDIKVGILCVTPENQTAPWLLFEAGALAKTVEDNDTYVCPYLIDMEKSQLKQGPLADFQAKESNKEETWELVQTLNKAVGENKGNPLTEEGLRASFEAFWPQLEQAIKNLPPTKEHTPRRDSNEMIEEILENTRTLTRNLKSIRTPPYSEITPSSSLSTKDRYTFYRNLLHQLERAGLYGDPRSRGFSKQDLLELMRAETILLDQLKQLEALERENVKEQE